MKVYIGQLNPTVGALTANAELIRAAYDAGVQYGSLSRSSRRSMAPSGVAARQKQVR